MLESRGWLAEARVLDCFAGSGALGIEALSRGAREAIFVESAPPAVRALRENLAASGFAGRSRVLPVDAAQALRMLGRDGVQVDGVLADPPYHTGWAQRLVDEVAAAGILADGGWIAVEHAANEPPQPPAGLAVVAMRRHGRSALSLVVRAEEGS